MKRTLFACSFFALAIATPASAATLVGDTIEGTYLFPNPGSVLINAGTEVVSPTADFTFITGSINPTALVSASNVLVTFAGSGGYASAAFNGIFLTNLTNSNISGFFLDPSSTVVGFDQSRLSFTANSLALNFQGLQIRSTDRISANVSFINGAVPEPATWAMMLLGFGFVGGAIRSAKRRQKLTVSYA